MEGLGSHSEAFGFFSEMGHHLSRQMAHSLMGSHCLRFRSQGQKQGDQLGGRYANPNDDDLEPIWWHG